MTRGWFVGDFSPSVIRSEAVEVAVRSYGAGDREAEHHHRIATEITVVVSGEVEMCGSRFRSGDIVVLEPFDATAFRAISDATTVVVKLPSVRDDKYDGVARPR